MSTYKGIVKNDTVVLPQGVHLPDGSEVEVRRIGHPASRDEGFARVLARRIHRYIGIDEIIEEDKREREERMV